ncbi:MAG: ABC transporter substrate-binding protein [Pseudomonadota bacterium]
MFMSRFRILAALIAAASATAPVVAQDAEPAAETQNSNIESAIDFAKALTAGATTALTDADASEAERLENFRVVLSDGLALETIGKFMLGESRKTMTDAQTARYNSIFSPYITKLYAEQFEEIVGKPLEVVDAKAIGSRDVIVRTQFERKDDAPIMVDWRVRKLQSGEHKAIDIIVSGVSIMLVKREEFSSFIASNGIDALLDRLEQETMA